MNDDYITKIVGHKNWTRRGDVVDVQGDVNLAGLELTRLPLKFGRVSGDFYCGVNQLESLAGAPAEVGGYFSCSDNQLESLAGAPAEVGGNFHCQGNKLESLAGAPAEVGGSFWCGDNPLNDLDWIPDAKFWWLPGDADWRNEKPDALEWRLGRV